MATIAIFGATGKTGLRVLDRALAAGHRMQVLARSPDKLADRPAALTVVEGDVLDSDAVDRTIAGAELVLSLIGHVKGSPPTLQADATRNMVDALRRHGTSRIITLSGGGLRDDEDRPKLPDRVIRVLLRMMAGRVLADAEQHLEVLRASGLDWTVVRAPRLSEAPGTGVSRVGSVGVGTGTTISRDDLAEFIVSLVDDERFVREMPFVSR